MAPGKPAMNEDVSPTRVVDFPASHNILGGGFKHFLFSPLFGEDSNFD